MSLVDSNNIPHLITSLQGPLLQLERHFLSHQIVIESWFRKQLRLTPPPIHCSVDLRNAGFKIAPVDTNLFPGGFNNLNPDCIPLCIQAVQSTMEQICPNAKKVLIIPENHTRNIHYYENIAILQRIFTKAGFEVKIGTLLPEITSPKELALPSQKKIVLEPISREGNTIAVNHFQPCLILLNNDLSAGVPEILLNLNQLILPPVIAGWHTRLKSKHFQHYQAVAKEFAKALDLDPWLISPLFRYSEQVDFIEMKGEKCLVEEAHQLLRSYSI